MAQVQLLTDWRGRHSGATLELTTGAAQVLINRNKARLIRASDESSQAGGDENKGNKKNKRKKA